MGRGNYLILFWVNSLLLTSIFFLVSCSKDKEDDSSIRFEIKATGVVYSSDEISTVKLVFDNDDVIVESPYQNDGFSLTLPDVVESEYLVNLGGCNVKKTYFEPTCLWGDILREERDVNWCVIDGFEAYDSDNEIIGYIYLGREQEESGAHAMTSVFTNWIFVDKKIDLETITLEKGWNILYWTTVYDTSKEDQGDLISVKENHIIVSHTISDKHPSNLRWYFESQ